MTVEAKQWLCGNASATGLGRGGRMEHPRTHTSRSLESLQRRGWEVPVFLESREAGAQMVPRAQDSVPQGQLWSQDLWHSLRIH